MQTQHINIEKVLRAKTGKKPKKWQVFLLKKMLCVDWMNEKLSEIGDEKGIAFMQKTIEVLGIRVEVKNEEKIPSEDVPTMFVCNHPLGGADVLSVVSVVGKYCKNGLLIPANDFLMQLSGIKDMLIPVNKVGNMQSKDLSQKINDAYASSSQLMFFPSGQVSRKNNGVIADCRWKKTFLSKSVEYKRQIVPIKIVAKNSWLFYVVAKLRAKLGIKFNIEMALLPREVKLQQGKTIQVIIGDSIDYQLFDNSKTPTEWAQYVRSKVYELQ